MEKFLIAGGAELRGTVRIAGAKNATLPIMAASLLCPGICTIYDVPDLRDVRVMCEILTLMGAKVEYKDGTCQLDTRNISSAEVPENLMREMRSSVFLMGALLGRLGRVKVSYPGGCAIGPRPIDLHLKGLAALGTRISERHGYMLAEGRELRGSDVHLDFPSVGATENIMMAAVRARGVTLIRNAAKEPEVVDLQNFLNKMGARIRGAGTDTIKIEGVPSLGPTTHSVIPDRIEAGTFMVAAAMTKGDIYLENVIAEHVEPVTAKLREAGAEVDTKGEGIRVTASGRLQAVDVKTLPYPGYPTDMQPQTMAMLSGAEGTSVIIENIFANRFKHVDELRRMGAQIKIEGRAAVIRGVERLSGAFVEASDLRAGVALVLAGLAAEGETVIDNIYHIDRGYDSLEKKLKGIGAKIERITDR
ncbi:MAG: UDP-N-acetylglucosamine 1-carboxyvinyltransferase [Firmicutes bacterium]|jgi:UDP-N-acetylglucosamine 1-carboxyvinyltransferase|nr:UDP-N-acetylglucosamine 1-carboxyvinyltransferase [Bacillota bacterium]